MRNWIANIVMSALALSLVVGSPGDAPADALDDAIAFLNEKGIKQGNAAIDHSNVGKVQYVSFPKAAAITDQDLAHLTVLPALTGADLSQSQVTDAGMETLARIPKLVNLRLYNVGVGDAGVTALHAASSLSNLDLSSTQITGDALVSIGGFQKLRNLNVTGTAVSAEGFKALQKLKTLKVMQAGNLKAFTPDMLPAIAGISSVTSLSFGFNDLDASIAGLAGSKVEQLGVIGTKLTDAGGITLGQLTELSSLSANGNKIGDPTIAAIATLPRLRLLQIPDTSVTDAAGPEFAKMKKLDTLWIDRTGVGDDFVAHLSGLPLTTLSLSDTQITDTGLKALEPIKTLKTLTVTKTDVTAEGVAALEAALPGLKVRF